MRVRVRVRVGVGGWVRPICESAFASEPLISLSQLASCVSERPKPVMEEATNPNPNPNPNP